MVTQVNLLAQDMKVKLTARERTCSRPTRRIDVAAIPAADRSQASLPQLLKGPASSGPAEQKLDDGERGRSSTPSTGGAGAGDKSRVRARTRGAGPASVRARAGAGQAPREAEVPDPGEGGEAQERARGSRRRRCGGKKTRLLGAPAAQVRQKKKKARRQAPSRLRARKNKRSVNLTFL